MRTRFLVALCACLLTTTFARLAAASAPAGAVARDPSVVAASEPDVATARGAAAPAQEADVAEGDAEDAPAARRAPTKLSLFTSAGHIGSYGASGSANGAALATGVRYAVGRRFALGFDLGYGLLGAGKALQDRWWFMPSMAVVIPARIANVDTKLDIGVGLGLGTASGYTSWSEYTAHPFTADWEFQLVPTARAHAILAFAVTPSLEIFTRAEAAAMVLPRGTNVTTTDSTWTMLSLGTRFRLL